MTTPSMVDPLLSIIVPVYNTEAYLEACLDSLLSTVSDDIEVVAVEDCGSDGSLGLLETYAAGDVRLRFCRQPRNLGLSEARNRGIEMSHGQFLLFVDSDDTLERGSLTQLLEILRAHPAVDVLRIGFRMVWPDKPYAVSVRTLDFDAVDGLSAMDFLSEAGAFDPLAQIHVVRRKFLGETGIQFLGGIYNEDNLFSFQILWSARAVVARSLYLYRYLQRPGSISKRSSVTHLKSSVLISRELRRLVPTGTQAARLLAGGLRFQAEINFKNAILSISPKERQAFWVWLSTEERFIVEFEKMFPSWTSRRLLKLSPQLHYLVAKWKSRLFGM